MSNMENKFQNILDNYINGNKHNFRKAVAGLTRVQLLDFIIFWSQYDMESEGNIIKIIQNELKFK